MLEQEWLAQKFEEHRPRLRSVAYRMLGSHTEADDAVQESWLKASRAGASDVDNLNGWMTTIVARVCLDHLRTRRSRAEESYGAHTPEPRTNADGAHDFEREEQLADSIGIAMLVVLEALAPAERVAFVLHDMFDVPFTEIASIVGRTTVATRQLASRARRRVQGAPQPEVDQPAQRSVVTAFLAASRDGNFDALLALLDPDVVMRVDPAILQAGVMTDSHGAQAVATQFSGKARAARLVLIDGAPGAAWAPGGTPRAVFEFAVENGRIVEIGLVGDASAIAEMEIEIVRG